MPAQTPLEIAQALVRLTSVNPHYDPTSAGEGAVVDWLDDWGRGHGLDTFRQNALPGRDNIFFRLRNGADRPHLLLNGHTDTVSVAGMIIPPFGGEVRDGRLWGRGSTDMKGPLAGMLAALLQLRASAATWRGTVTVGCVVEEETQYRGILALLERNEHYDFAIVGEPTGLRVVRGCKGAFRFGVRTTGRAAHSSEPEKGRNAIVAMAPVLEALQDYFNTGLRRFQVEGFTPSTGSIGLIEGGSGINIVPENCAIQIDIRSVPGQSWDETLADMQAHLSRRLPDINNAFIIDPLRNCSPAFATAADHPLVRTACAVLGRSGPETVAFGCDASKTAAAGIPSIIVGPSEIALAHTADESISLADLDAGCDAYLRLVRALLPPN